MLELTGTVLQPVCGIYEIRNTQTGQCYIGQSRNIPARWAGHFAALGMGRHKLLALQRDWNQYGPDAFKASVVKVVIDTSNLLTEENATAIEYLRINTKLYNAAIAGWFNEEEREIRARAVIAQEEGVLQRKRANDNESWNQRGGDSSDENTVRGDGRIQGGRRILGDSTGASMESDQRGICEPKTGLRIGKQGVDTAANAERPASKGMDEDGRRRECYQDNREVLPVFNRYAADVLTEHLPDEEKERYLQELITNVFCVTGGSAVDLALIILTAFSEKDVQEVREVLAPNMINVFFDEEDDDALAAFDHIAATYPGGVSAWLLAAA